MYRSGINNYLNERKCPYKSKNEQFIWYLFVIYVDLFCLFKISIIISWLTSQETELLACVSGNLTNLPLLVFFLHFRRKSRLIK